MDSKELKMFVSESDKMEDSLLGNRFSKKAEHLPIKKRRILFRTSSPPPNTDFSEGPEKDAGCYNSSSNVVQPKLDASCQPAASTTVADLCQSGSIDSKMDGEKIVEASKKTSENEDICGISLAASNNGLVGGADPCEVSGIVSHGTESLEAPDTVIKVEANFEMPANISTEETDLHIAITPSKDVTSSTLDCSPPDKATVDESTLENSGLHPPSESECSRINQLTSKTQKSADRFNWDLNTVMDAWEEPLERCEQRRVPHRSASENVGSEILPVGLKSLAHTIEGSEQEECKPDIGKLLSPVSCGTCHVAVNNKIKSIDAIPMVVPCTIKMEYPECDVSAKHVMRERQASPIPSPLNKIVTNPLSPQRGNVHFKNTDDSSTVVGSGNNVNHAITSVQTTECEKLNLSLVTAASPENGVHQSTSTFDVDDKSEVKKAITSNGITMDNLIGKGTEDAYRGDSKEVNQTTFGSLLVMQSSVLPEGEDHPAVAVSSLHVVCSDAEVPIKAEKSPLTATSGMTQLTETIYHTSHESDTDFPSELVSYNKEVCEEARLDNGFGYENFSSDIQAGSEVDNIDEFSVGYDSQFEDGELRESSIQTWEEDRENEHGIENRGTRFHLGTLGDHNNDSQCLPERSTSRIRSPDVGSQRGTDEISSVLLPEKLDSSDQVSGSESNETKNATIEVSIKDASQSDQWKMNVSGLDFVPENHIPTNNTTSKMRDLSSIKFSSRIERHGPETEDLETKAEGSRFYRREPLSRIGEPSMRDAFLNRGRFKMQGCSSINNGDDLDSRSIRESGVMRSLGRGKYSPQVPASGRGGGPWNRSPGWDRDLNHLRSPPYPGPSFRPRSLPEDVTSVDNLTNEISVDPNDDGRPVVASSSYINNRQSFGTRLLANREEDEFRARLGLRPSGDTSYHNRFGNVGRGRSPRYGSRHNGGGPRGQYYAPSTDEYDEPSMEYSHPFPNRRHCPSPTERRENHPCTHHHSGSTSPPRSRTRSPITDGFRRRTSRSPRIRRPRSPNYRRGFEPDQMAGGYNLETRNNTSPPNSRWVKYKQRSSAFDRRSPPPPPPPPIGERLNFYDPSRKTKPNENYRSGHPGRFSGRGGPRYLGSDGDLTDHGYRRGGFVRRYDMGRPVKHFQYDDEDGYGPVYDSRDKEALVINGRGNPKQPPYSNGNDSRFPRRPREERENW